MNRKELLYSFYKTDSITEIVKQFESALRTTTPKEDIETRHTVLIEQLLHFSYALTYGLSVNSMLEYRYQFMAVAKKSRSGIRLSGERVENAFKVLPRPTKPKIEKSKKEIEDVEKKEIIEENPTEKKNIARKLKRRVEALEKDLNDKSIPLLRNQKREDFENYIKVAIVTLATGVKLVDILNGSRWKVSKDTVIVGSDYKTISRYVNSIRKHIEANAQDRVERYTKSYQKMLKEGVTDVKKLDRAKRLSEKTIEDIDSTVAIEKGVAKLKPTNGDKLQTLQDLHHKAK